MIHDNDNNLNNPGEGFGEDDLPEVNPIPLPESLPDDFLENPQNESHDLFHSAELSFGCSDGSGGGGDGSETGSMAFLPPNSPTFHLGSLSFKGETIPSDPEEIPLVHGDDWELHNSIHEEFCLHGKEEEKIPGQEESLDSQDHGHDSLVDHNYSLEEVFPGKGSGLSFKGGIGICGMQCLHGCTSITTEANQSLSYSQLSEYN